MRNPADVLLASYGYNGLNHRVRKTGSGVVTTSFFNASWQELESVTSGTTTVYVWGQRYIDDLVLRDKGQERLYSIADPNWNVVALTNASGTVQERMRYDAFGKVTWLDAAFAVKAGTGFVWNRTFTGQVLDGETGLMLYRNRFYHTGLGRFVSRDPIGYAAGDVGLYRYVKNVPIHISDSFGLWAKDDTGVLNILKLLDIFDLFKKDGGITHESLTNASWEELLKQPEYANLSCGCLDKILDLLIEANKSQDNFNLFPLDLKLIDRRRHYMRITVTQSKKDADEAYTDYIKEEMAIFEQSINSGNVCDAIKALGRLTHTWQDFYAHSIASQGIFPLIRIRVWTKGLQHGTPDDIGQDIIGVALSEHGLTEPTSRLLFALLYGNSDAEANARREGAISFVLDQLKSMVPKLLEFDCQAITDCK